MVFGRLKTEKVKSLGKGEKPNESCRCPNFGVLRGGVKEKHEPKEHIIVRRENPDNNITFEGKRWHTEVFWG